MRTAHPLLLLLALAGAATAAPQSPAAGGAAAAIESVRERVARRCQPVLERLIGSGLPGVSAALVLPDGSEVALTAGFASKEDGRPMRAEDRLLLGSIGKTYVTAAAHLLASAGKLSFDDYAVDYFVDEEWFERIPNAGDITIRQLLRHQTGLERYEFKPAFWAKVMSEPDKVWKPEELLAYVFDDDPLFPAGERWAYADTNYIVLGMIIEKVSGRAFYDYVKENLLDPHGLEDTVPSDSRRIPGLVQGYAVSSRGLGVPERTIVDGVFVFNPQFEWCGGGYACTPLDLARWARILYSGQAFDAPYLATMLESVPAPMLGRGRAYGLGVIVSRTELGPLLGHDGFMPGYMSTMGYFPDHSLALAVQTNTDDQRAIAEPLVDVTVELAKLALEELGQ